MTIFTASQAVQANATYTANQAQLALTALIAQYQYVFDEIQDASNAGNTSLTINFNRFDYNNVISLLTSNGYVVSSLPTNVVASITNATIAGGTGTTTTTITIPTGNSIGNIPIGYQLTGTPIVGTVVVSSVPAPWVNTATYTAGTIVQLNNISYLATSNNTNSPPPSSNWTALSNTTITVTYPAQTITSSNISFNCIIPSTDTIIQNPTTIGWSATVVYPSITAISPTSLSVTVNTLLNVQFLVTGGTAPFTWALSGILNTGLTFNTTTGVLTGTPTQVANEYNATTITVTDSQGKTFSQPISLIISPPFIPSTGIQLLPDPTASATLAQTKANIYLAIALS